MKKSINCVKDVLTFVSLGFVTILIIIAIIAAIIISPLSRLFPMRTLNKYFKNIPNEDTDECVVVLSDEIVLNGERVCKSISNLTENVRGFLNLDYYYLQNNTLYFLAKDSSAKKSGDNYAFDIYVGKLDLSNNEVDYEYLGGFGKNGQDDYDSSHYKPYFEIDTARGEDNFTTSVFVDNCIFVKDSARAVKYSIDQGTVEYDLSDEEISRAFSRRYQSVISEEGDAVTITRLSDGTERRVTLEEIAKTSPAADKILLDLSDRNIRWGHAYTQNAFRYSNLYEIDGEVYISTFIYNWFGEGVCVFYKYDFDTNRFYYVSAGRPTDPPNTHYLLKLTE